MDETRSVKDILNKITGLCKLASHSDYKNPCESCQFLEEDFRECLFNGHPRTWDTMLIARIFEDYYENGDDRYVL